MTTEARLGEILDALGQLTASGRAEVAIGRGIESPLTGWRVELQSTGSKRLVVDDGDHSLAEALKKLVLKHERASGRKAAR